jgi:signal transduction histidine kinase
MAALIQMNSIRIRMLSGFLFLVFLLLIMALASLSLLNQSKRVDQINLSINQLQVLTLNMIKSDNDFFDLDLSAEDYFKTRRSARLRQRDSLNLKIQGRIVGIIEMSNKINYTVKDKLLAIRALEKEYTRKFYELEKLSFERGFKDYGLEGQMRQYAHELERSSLDIYFVLTLRRHEKDFLLRHDTTYLNTFNRLADALAAKLDKTGKHKTLALLRQYQTLFNQLARVELLIGLNSNRGLRNELNTLTFQISNQFYNLANYSDDRTTVKQRNISIFYLSILAGALLFSILSALWISKRLSAPIADLSRLMVNATREGSHLDNILPNAATEINTLMDSFRKLMAKTAGQMKEIRSQSKLAAYQNKKLKKLNSELDSFLYSTAHDLRSPLASLSGLIRLAQLENQQPSLTDYFDRMKTSVAKQEEFITQIAGYTKNKKLGLILEPIDLKVLIFEIFEAHRFGEDRKIALAVTMQSNTKIYSDRTRIQIVFNNLISNAIRYSDPAKDNPQITVFIAATEREVNVELTDNGIGIEREHQAKIFDMFYRANVNSKGSGLGLFILKETLGKLQGKVSIESAPGIGTTFRLTIPNFTPSHRSAKRKEKATAVG